MVKETVEEQSRMCNTNEDQEMLGEISELVYLIADAIRPSRNQLSRLYDAVEEKIYALSSDTEEVNCLKATLYNDIYKLIGCELDDVTLSHYNEVADFIYAWTA